MPKNYKSQMALDFTLYRYGAKYLWWELLNSIHFRL